MARVNPSLQNEQAQYNPVNRVTGLFEGHDAVTAALADLREAGIARDDIDILAGTKGEEVLDPSGNASTIGRWYRKLEDWISDTSKFQELASATLAAGGFVVAAKPRDDGQRERIMELLTRHGARDVKYWATWYVEQGHEDEPRQNLKRDDQ
jgi:hypothetical protein